MHWIQILTYADVCLGCIASWKEVHVQVTRKQIPKTCYIGPNIEPIGRWGEGRPVAKSYLDRTWPKYQRQHASHTNAGASLYFQYLSVVFYSSGFYPKRPKTIESNLMQTATICEHLFLDPTNSTYESLSEERVGSTPPVSPKALAGNREPDRWR